MHRKAQSLKRFDLEIEATALRMNAERVRRLRRQQDQMANNDANQSFGQLGVPTLTQTSIPCIVKPNFGTENFELKPHLIQMIERNHIADFIERCDTITANPSPLVYRT